MDGVDLENTDTPKYLGVTLYRTLSYKTHIHNTKMKVATRNDLLNKLENSRWGTNARAFRTTALALCYSTAEYAAPVWERFGRTPARSRLKSRRSFLTSVQPANFPEKAVNEWKRILEEKAHAGLVNMYEDIATGHDSPWLNWRCLNRLRTEYTCSKEQRKKWGYFNGDTTCECGLAAVSTAHMLQCSLLAHPCTLDDLLEFNDTAQAFTERWKKIV